jgi:hypothetical protein
VCVADDPAGAGDDAASQQFELGRVEEVDQPLFIVVRAQAETFERRLDLMLGHGGLDLDSLGPRHRIRHFAHRRLAALLHANSS